MRRARQVIGLSRRGLVLALWVLALLAGAMAPPASAAETGRRVALVVGNSSYMSLPKLRNPASDANLVAASLAKLGFEVVSMSDATFENLKAVVARFGEMARGADVALFYFAGHGVQVGGANYLLPIDASVKSAADLGSQGLDIGRVIEEIKKAAPHASVVILDACRDNPLPAGVAGSDGGLAGAPLTSGLARVQGMSGLLIAYATAPGQVAYDGFGANSPFAAALAHYLDEPGLEVGMLFRRVRQRVIETTAGAQIPWVEEALLEPLYVHPEGAAITQATDVERLNGALEIEEPEMRLAALVDLAAAPKDPSILPVVASHIERLREPDAPVTETASKRLVQELVDWHRLRMIQSRPAARLAATAFLQLHPDGVFAERAHGFIEGEAAPAETAGVSEADAESVWLLVSRLDQTELFDRFVELVPSGRFADLAQARRKVQLAALPIAGPNARTATSPTGQGSDQHDSAGTPTPANRSVLPVFVGTGPTQITLPMTPTLLTITAPPKYGTLIAEQDDGAVAEIRTATQGLTATVRKLSYRPDPEARDVVDEFVIAAATPTDRGLAVGDAADVAAPMTLRADIKPHQCDLLAGARFDTQGVVTGLYPNEIDPGPAITACREAIEAFPGIARFRYQLGRALAVAGRNEEAARAYREAADSGHYAALYELGTLYERGAGVAKDLDKAIGLFNEAAAHDDLYAATRLGVLYRDGKGVPKDTAKAIAWLVKAAHGGHTFAFNHLGYMYLEGNGVEPDYERAFRLFEASANAGDIYGYNNMGLMYERGKFVAADPAKAIAWYEKAARGGQPQAPVNLGLMYLGDHGVPADLKRAAYWFAEAARLGNGWGFTNLGWLYQSGRGVDPDPGLAAELYAEAFRLGPDDAGAAAAKNFGKLPPKAAIRAIQKHLAALGFDTGTPDGSLSKQTRTAIGAFAKDRGLELDANAPKIRILAALIDAQDHPKAATPAAN